MVSLIAQCKFQYNVDHQSPIDESELELELPVGDEQVGGCRAGLVPGLIELVSSLDFEDRHVVPI